MEVYLFYILKLKQTQNFLQSGVYIFELFNNYAVGGTTMLFLAVVETVAIGHLYGGEKFMEDIKLMIGYRVPVAFKYCIQYVTPSLTTVGSF